MMTDSYADFDWLAEQAFGPARTREVEGVLWQHVFALPKWYFIARGEFPNIHPYVAKAEGVAYGQFMIRAFTDTDRLYRFCVENELQAEGADALILELPTDSVLDYLDQFISSDVFGIWFNSNTGSKGFFSPLAQLRPIRDYVKSLPAQDLLPF